MIKYIIDLLLKDKIIAGLRPNEVYEGVNWGRKIKIIIENYDKKIGENIQEIFRIGGEGSHFNGKVSDEELQKIINSAIHIVEDIFVKYFLEPEHNFGKENIFTIFSMLPLCHRIYILENLSTYYTNPHIIDRLSLAYLKSEQKNKAIELLETSLDKIDHLSLRLSELYEKNTQYENNQESFIALVEGNQLIVGLPTSKDIFDTAKAVQIFSEWFQTNKEKYPEFINLFLYLMKTDNRQYN